MPGIVDFPEIIKEASIQYRDIFSCEPQRRHFAEYLTGLIVARSKSVNGIASEFADSRDQSCLNRFLTSVQWDEKLLNTKRLQILQDHADTRYNRRGVIAIDNVLIDHDGKFIKDVGWFWDHAEQRNKIAHDYLFANYVCPSGKHYPLDFLRFKKKEQCEHTGEIFQNHTKLCIQLVDWVCKEKIPGDFTFDSYFTNTEILNHVNAQRNKNADGSTEARAYVGDLKFNRKLEWRQGVLSASELAESIDPQCRKEIVVNGEKQWYFTVTLRLPKVNHRVRILILWQFKRDEKPRKILITNRVNWDVTRMVETYKKRWTGTETFHRDGKQELGMGDCQLRDGRGQTRHMYLVMAAYSILMSELDTARAQGWALERLMTIGQACRAVVKEVLRKTITWTVNQLKSDEVNLSDALLALRLA